MLPVSRRLWRPEVSGTSLPHHPPSDLTISTSPGSYPCQYGSIPYWRGHQSPQMSRNLPQDKPLIVVITDPCCQTSILQSIPLSLLQPLQYFLSNFAHFLIPKCYSFPSGNEKNLFVVWMPVLFYQKLCVVFRGITTIQLFLAQQDVPGVGTKLSINFEPFLVLDQWTTLCTCHAAIIRRDEFQEIQLIHVSCLCDPNAESHKMTFGNFSFLLFRWHFYEIIILVYKFRRKNMNHNSSHFL